MDTFVEHTFSEESDEYDSSITTEREAALYGSAYHSCDAYKSNDHKEQDCMPLVNTTSVKIRYFHEMQNKMLDTKGRWSNDSKNNNGNYIRNFVNVDLDYRGDLVEKNTWMQTIVNTSTVKRKERSINISYTKNSESCFAQGDAEGVSMPEFTNHVSKRSEQKRNTEKYQEVLIISSSEENDSIVEVPISPKPGPPVLLLDSSDETSPVPDVSTKPLLNGVPHSYPKLISTSNVAVSKSSAAQEHDNSSLNNSLTSIHDNSKLFKKNKRKRKIKSMGQFYNKSWGGETFDHIEIQKNMSNNPQLWQILDVDKYGPPHNQHLRVRCRNCMQIGHIENDCRDPKKILCCFMCGQQGHGEYRCPFKICLKCGRPASFFSSGCQSCWSKDHPVNCGTCGDTEHFSWMCPTIWRKFHAVTSSEDLANTQLQVQLFKPPRELCCCFCAGHGHTATHCPLSFQTKPNILVNSPHPIYPHGLKRKRTTGSFNRREEYEFYRKRRKRN